MRIFIAIPVTDVHIQEIERFRKANDRWLRDEINIHRLRWMKDDTLHLTALFIGEVESGKLESIQNEVKAVARQFTTFQLKFEQFCFAPSVKKSSMIWARYAENDFFTSLQGQLAKRISNINSITGLHEKAIPHINIARFQPFLSEGKNFRDAGKMSIVNVDCLEIWQSHLDSDGARYDSLAHFKLKSIE